MERWAKRVLNGAYATVKVNGYLLAECQGNNATVHVNRAEIADGADIDSKMLSRSGEGNMQVWKVYTQGKKKLHELYAKGEDPRFVIENRIADPDAVGKQIDDVTLTNVWFNDYSLFDWTRNDATPSEISYGFTPTDAMVNEVVGQL